MIRVEYDRKSHQLIKVLKGDSDLLLFEFHVLTEQLLEAFLEHGQEVLVLDEITDVVSEFAEKHTPKSKGEKKDD